MGAQGLIHQVERDCFERATRGRVAEYLEEGDIIHVCQIRQRLQQERGTKVITLIHPRNL